MFYVRTNLTTRCFMENKDNKCTVTVFVLATNETEALEETISQIYALRNIDCIEKIIIFAKNDSCPAYECGHKLISEHTDNRIEVYVQKADDFEQCFIEMPPLVKTTHCIHMAADMEMYPPAMDMFIDKAKQRPRCIISASKWHKDSVVEGYSSLRKLITRSLNFVLGCFTGFKATEFVSMYRIFPMCLFNEMNFSKNKYFGYEYFLKPFFFDIEYEEVPTVYKPRSDGHSNFNPKKLWRLGYRFIFNAIRLWFQTKVFSKKSQNKR